MPFDVLAQREGQLGAVLAPIPAGREVWHDRSQAGLRYILPVHDQIVEDAHHRAYRRRGRLLMQRYARRAVEMRDVEGTAGLLRDGGMRRDHSNQQRDSRREYPLRSLHFRLPIRGARGIYSAAP